MRSTVPLANGVRPVGAGAARMVTPPRERSYRCVDANGDTVVDLRAVEPDDARLACAEELDPEPSDPSLTEACRCRSYL